jgi:hypothetical protein
MAALAVVCPGRSRGGGAQIAAGGTAEALLRRVLLESSIHDHDEGRRVGVEVRRFLCGGGGGRPKMCL